MKKPFKYFFDSIITSIVGTATMLISLFLIWTGAISFKWDGAIGLGIGCLLLIAPRFLERAILETIKSWGKRAGGWMGWGNNNYDNDEKPRGE